MRKINWKLNNIGDTYNATNMPPGTCALIYPDGNSYILEVDINLNKFYFSEYKTLQSAKTFGGKRVVKILNERAKTSNDAMRW
jgi:hypothetical protein